MKHILILAACSLSAAIPASAQDPQETRPDPYPTAFRKLTETLASSAKADTLHVAWLIGRSSSLEAIRERLAQDVGKIDVKPKEGNSATATVAGFSDELRMITPRPLAVNSAIGRAIARIETDPSGKSNVFTAVTQAAERLAKQGSQGDARFLVIVTDERGDDPTHLEAAVSRCQRSGIRVFCLGHAAPFGTGNGPVRQSAKAGLEDGRPGEQGPETAMLTLPVLPWLGGTRIDPGSISSGFGPWALTRLCQATSGQYALALDSTKTRFDPEVMEKYRPEHLPLREFEVAVRKNRARMALVQSSQLSRQRRITPPKLTFQADRYNILRARLTDTQRTCAVLDYQCLQVLKFLQAARDHNELTSPRWQASYDLAMGRAAAAQVRVRSLNVELAQMKVNAPKIEDPQLNTWQIHAIKEGKTLGASERKLMELARDHLNRVLTEHPDTPFAHVAKLELDRGFGWKWRAIHIDYPPQPPPEKSVPRRRPGLLP